MMENVNEFIKNFRERLASPFFFSFIISWIFINWKVTVALLWYNAELFARNKSDLINYIEINTSDWKSLVLPFIGAVLYTGILKNLISAFITWTSKWGGNWNLNITKGGKVAIDKFLIYRDLYKKTNQELQKVIEDEKDMIQKFDQQQQKLISAESENVRLEAELTRLKAANHELEADQRYLSEIIDGLNHNGEALKRLKDLSFLDGKWQFTYSNTFRKLKFEEMFDIKNGKVSVINAGQKEDKLQIIHSFHDIISNKLLLVLKYIERTPEQTLIQQYIEDSVKNFSPKTNLDYQVFFRSRYALYIVQDLIFTDSVTLSGTENMEAGVTYHKLD